MTDWSHIHRPTLVVSESRVRRNIRRMVEKARNNRKVFSPHMKSHQSKTIARWYLEEGVERITVSSVGMAEYFASDFWEDITIAFPCNIREIARINELAKKVELTLLVDSLEIVRRLSATLEARVKILIEVDTGYGRTGVRWDNDQALLLLQQEIGRHKALQFDGFYTHAGNTYAARSGTEIKGIAGQAIKNFEKAVSFAAKNKRIVYGDTPSCSVLESFGEVITDLSPGNFVFYDLAQVEIGSCTMDDIAVAMFCPVVTSGDNHATIYGGGAHFCKDALDDGSFGRQVVLTPTGWEATECGVLAGLSQEHGRLDHANVHPGEVIAILPVHSCMTGEMMGKYLTTQGLYLDHYLKNR